MFDCLKGLIGFTQSNDCIGELPVGMRYAPASGVYMDEHPMFQNAVINQRSGFWSEDNAKLIEQADATARLELGKEIVTLIRTRVNQTFATKSVELGETTGAGYLSNWSSPAVLSFGTNVVPDANFYITHIGIIATLLSTPQTVVITFAKNGTPLKTYTVTVQNNSHSRTPLPVPERIDLDGSTYSFTYSFTAQMFPVKNDFDCGCDTIRSGYTCFFKPFDGNAGGIRLLGELRCNELLLPCNAAGVGLAGLHIAGAYRALLLNVLFRLLVSNRSARINAFTLLKSDSLAPVIAELNAEYEGELAGFIANWGGVASCCYEAKSTVMVASMVGDNTTDSHKEFERR